MADQHSRQLADLKGKKLKVAIIGAGPGGLSLGFELLRAGCGGFTIFEATNRSALELLRA